MKYHAILSQQTYSNGGVDVMKRNHGLPERPLVGARSPLFNWIWSLGFMAKIGAVMWGNAHSVLYIMMIMMTMTMTVTVTMMMKNDTDDFEW